jgi:hypothetical protein
LTNFIKLKEIAWPVYRLSEKPPIQKQGITFFATEYLDSNNETSYVIKVVDDLSLEGKTLGIRRLKLREDKNTKVHNISVAIYFLADLIKLAKTTTWFIDNNGKIFQYKKSTRAKLEIKKISQVLPAAGLGCVLEIEGLSQRFKCLIRPKTEEYAVLLNLGKSYMLYGFSETKKPNSWRLI